jgi:hypothetical protein
LFFKAVGSGGDNSYATISCASLGTGASALTFGVKVSAGYNVVEAMRINPSGYVGIGTNSPAARTHFFGSRIEGDTQYGYMRAYTFQGSSAFSNPSVPLITINAGSGYQMYNILVKVFQQSWAGNICIVSQGVAMISNNLSGTAVYTPYAGTMTVIGGNSTNIGTLSWTLTSGAMPATLYYNGVRVTNYDSYGITVEIGTSTTGGGSGNHTWGGFNGS